MVKQRSEIVRHCCSHFTFVCWEVISFSIISTLLGSFALVGFLLIISGGGHFFNWLCIIHGVAVSGNNADEVGEEGINNCGKVKAEYDFLLSCLLGETNSIISSSNYWGLVPGEEIGGVPACEEGNTNNC